MGANESPQELLKRRAVDNILPQSAYDFVDSPSPIDTHARDCFCRFVDAYVNTPQRITLLPQTIAGPHHVVAGPEIFVQLWQDGAAVIENADAPSDGAELAGMWERFCDSLAVNAQPWSEWLRFSWNGTLSADLMPRIPDWRARWLDIRREVKLHTSSLAIAPQVGEGFTAFRNLLFNKNEHWHIPREYALLCRNDGDVRDLATAYCFDVFRRATPYAQKCEGISVSFHPLRDGAIVASDVSVGPQIEHGPDEISWGDVLRGLLETGTLSREAQLIIEVLRPLRAIVQSYREYEERIQMARAEPNSTRRTELYRDAALSALLDLHIPPPLRKLYQRKTAQASEVLSGVVNKLYGIPYELVRAIFSNDTFRELDIRARRQLGRDKVWKSYWIPRL